MLTVRGILKKNGSEALIKSCKYTINSFDYLLKRLLNQFGGESPESKESVAKGMLPYINSIISDIRKEACFQKLEQPDHPCVVYQFETEFWY